MKTRLKSIIAEGGEGVVMKSPTGFYERKRSWGMIKAKECLDAEGEIL